MGHFKVAVLHNAAQYRIPNKKGRLVKTTLLRLVKLVAGTRPRPPNREDADCEYIEELMVTKTGFDFIKTMRIK